eukprot:CAMPEP_0119052574 /NCGR_PEP_ID=MMETSP1177-20130426/73829_1 /TAXON_ID=2985 /ORGANISM="Ochromonas sp, Strain CCMP1899" /LENGTH=259 /DNA_ID=CAMNT_0007032193 /DNA_START=79 /DNA_END=858 /DNA_ORIENTATION=+
MCKNGSIFIVLILLLCLQRENALFVPSNQWISNIKSNVKKTLSVATAVICIGGLPISVLAEEPLSFQSQLKLIQDNKTSQQKEAIEKAEQDLQTKELLYPEGKLIGRGIVNLIPESGDPKLFPYGLSDASSYDSRFMGEKATMFVLAVGREGPPLARQKVLLKDITFPYAFEVLTNDLIFPLSKETWLSNKNRKDTIALTVILSPDDLLKIPNPVGRIGFAVSEPIQVAGSNGRTTAQINVNGRVDTIGGKWLLHPDYQ